MIKKLFFWLTIFVTVIFIFNNFILKKKISKIDYSSFLLDIKNNKIKEIKVNGNEINVIKKNNNKYITYIPIKNQNLLKKIIKKNIKISSIPIKKPNIIISTIISWLPIIIISFIWIIFINKIYNSKNSIFFEKNKAKILNKNKKKITFKNIAGYNEIKEDINEIIEYLKNPNKFKKLGCKIPKGILIIGPPGTGKTLLARAIAWESKVPFYNISGSDFIEMFVGIGALRVRNMFKEAKKNSPCIIFIDEIDAIGKHRSTLLNNGNDEREQTLNQMLVEMDGFNNNKGIIIIAATNRPDILDNALTRPGRFDKKIIIDLPNFKERIKIIQLHTKKTPLNKNVNIKNIARNTPGFSGADLANLINEASLEAAKKNKKNISMKEFEKSKDKIIMGAEKKSLIITKEQKELLAYHESGHAIVGELLKDHNKVYKITIIPRGKSLGITSFIPNDDNININKKKLESQISTLYAGRIAEEIIYGEDNISIGSSNDIKIATLIAKNMVTKWGFSKKIGPLLYNEKNEIFNNYKNIYISDYILKNINKEVKKIIDKNYLIAKKILLKNINILHKMKKKLIKYETLDRKQIKKIIFKKN